MTQTHPDRPAPRQPRVSGTIQVDLRHDHCRLRSDVFALEGAWPGSTVELLVGTRRPGDLTRTHLLSVLAATACARALVLNVIGSPDAVHAWTYDLRDRIFGVLAEVTL